MTPDETAAVIAGFLLGAIVTWWVRGYLVQRGQSDE